MTLITPDECVSRSADVYKSLLESLSRLREQAEDLRKQLEAGEDADLADGSKRVLTVDRLVMSCQRAEIILAEQQNRKLGIVRGGYALDLDAARHEVGCRLARLRRCGD
jgi:hypothetical protein